jgi:hypothetical protein
MLASRGEIIAGSGCTLLARVLDSSGQPLQVSEVAAITVNVFDMTTAIQTTAIQYSATALSPLAPQVSSVLTTLTTGPMWTADAVGYNFNLTLPGTAFPNGATSYQVVVAITPIVGGTVMMLWELAADYVY